MASSAPHRIRVARPALFLRAKTHQTSLIRQVSANTVDRSGRRGVVWFLVWSNGGLVCPVGVGFGGWVGFGGQDRRTGRTYRQGLGGWVDWLRWAVLGWPLVDDSALGRGQEQHTAHSTVSELQ